MISVIGTCLRLEKYRILLDDLVPSNVAVRRTVFAIAGHKQCSSSRSSRYVAIVFRATHVHAVMNSPGLRINSKNYYYFLVKQIQTDHKQDLF